MPSAIHATASNVYQNQDEFGPEMAFDNDLNTRWATDAGTKQAWIALELKKPMTVAGVTIREAYPGRVRKFELQYKEGDSWKTILPGGRLSEGADGQDGSRLGNYSVAFPPITARRLRLNILEAVEGPTIAEIRWVKAK